MTRTICREAGSSSTTSPLIMRGELWKVVIDLRFWVSARLRSRGRSGVRRRRDPPARVGVPARRRRGRRGAGRFPRDSDERRFSHAPLSALAGGRSLPSRRERSPRPCARDLAHESFDVGIFRRSRSARRRRNRTHSSDRKPAVARATTRRPPAPRVAKPGARAGTSRRFPTSPRRSLRTNTGVPERAIARSPARRSSTARVEKRRARSSPDPRDDRMRERGPQ